VLNQTLWNWHFETESITDPMTGKITVKPTAKLNGAGRAKLDSISRTRPSPDTRIYLQAARDVVMVDNKVDAVRTERENLTAQRAATVQTYLAASPSVNMVAYEVFVHDAVVPTIPSEFTATSFRGQRVGYVGGLNAGGGTAALSTGSGGLLQPAQPTMNTTNSTSTNTNINATGPGAAGPVAPGP
jgi:hypothetical protein